ncbi:MAG: DUF928 domain-containing protein [Gammaproteobacteria bacterium]|nr:DUF928 domain-containing protein [Gammaproteobacteria bacterium]
MKTICMIAGLVAGGILLPQVMAESLPASGSAKSGLSAQITRMPSYTPPRRGAPSTRVGGGTRGIDREVPSLYALAPDHVGLTGSEQPTLSWYMSKPTTMRFEFLLIDEEGIEPLLEITLDSNKLKAGIQGVNLADYGVRLKPGAQYQWSVALVPDAKHRSSDIISGGMIERRIVGDSVAARLQKAGTQEDAFIYAEEGYWYDAVSELSSLIEKAPGNEILKQQRAVLLKQAGLPGS